MCVWMDGKRNLRLFYSKLHQKLQGFHERKEAVVAQKNSELLKSLTMFSVDLSRFACHGHDCEVVLFRECQ